MKLAAVACTALAVLMFGASAASALTTSQLRTIDPEGPAPKRGIGPVRLEERLAEVAAILGPGREVEASKVVEGETSYSEYDYNAAGVTLEVVYGLGFHAAKDEGDHLLKIRGLMAVPTQRRISGSIASSPAESRLPPARR